MYGVSYDLTLPIFILLFSLISGFIIRKHRFLFSKQVLIHMVFAFYVLVMIKLVILPIHIPGMSYNPTDWQDISFLQMIPFATITQMLSNGNWFIQILGNIGVCLPVSFFLYYYSGKLKLMTHLTFAIFLSVMFELCQFAINVITKYPNRVVDIDDVLLNSFGVMLGYITILIIKRLFTLKVIKTK